MTVQRTMQKPQIGPSGYGVTDKKAEQTKEFNKSSSFVQGFRTTLPATGETPVTIKLNSPGKFLHGISIIPASGVNADIADCTISLTVNGLNTLTKVAANNANPTAIQGFVFLAAPQPLQGDDNITVTIEKNSGAGTPVVYTNIFYLPR